MPYTLSHAVKGFDTGGDVEIRNELDHGGVLAIVAKWHSVTTTLQPSMEG